MNELLVKILLFFYSLLLLLFHNTGLSTIVISLLVIILFCLCFFLENKNTSHILLLFYGIFVFFDPAFFIFFPVFLYDIVQYKSYLSAIVLFCTLLQHRPAATMLPFILLGCAISCMCQYLVRSYQSLDCLYKKTRDDSTERAILLKDINRNLLERQDYEIYTATLRERNRIAREIHDNVGHLLSRSILMVAALKAVHQKKELCVPLNQLDETLNTAMTSIRESVHNLHNEFINLEETLSDIINRFTFCPISFTYQMSHILPREIKYSFISIVNESLSNIIKHSNCSHVTIQLKEFSAFYQLTIQDNGKNIHLKYSGIGLVNMQERILSLNGHIHFNTSHGFEIFLTVPKEYFQKRNEALK